MRPTRRSVLLGAGAGLVAPALAEPRPPALILLLAHGGWDTTYALDPKPGVAGVEGPEVDIDPDDPLDVEALATFGGTTITTNAARRPAVTAFFERWGDRSAVVNGVAVGSIAHRPAQVRMTTGTRTAASPDLAAVAGHVHRGDRALAMVELSGGAYFGPFASECVRFGARNQVRTLVDRGSAFPMPGVDVPQVAWDAADRERMEAHLARRIAAAGDAGLLAAHEAAVRLRTEHADLFEQLPIGRTPSLDAALGLAVELLARDVCTAVVADTGLPWDTHESNVDQHAHHDALFAALDGLAATLDEAGELDRTLVLVVSELTRTPERHATAGKDHWPHASVLALGGRVVGGRTRGATDDRLESLPVDLSTGEPDPSGDVPAYDALVAGLLELLDVDPREWLPGVVPYRALAT